jgi:hypothetical protein
LNQLTDKEQEGAHLEVSFICCPNSILGWAFAETRSP